jgi:hypothetical protein
MRFTSEQRLDDGVLEREFTLGEIPGVLWTPIRSEPMSEPRRMMPWRRTTTMTAVARRPHCGNVRRISDARGVRRPGPGRNGKGTGNGVPAGTTNEEPGATALRPTVRQGMSRPEGCVRLYRSSVPSGRRLTGR